MKPNHLRVIFSLLILTAAASVSVFPVFYILAMASHGESAFTMDISLKTFTSADLHNFRQLFLRTDFLIWLRNSVLISTVVALVGVAMASMSGYALARFQFPGRSWILRSILTTQMFPASMLMLPFFIVLTKLHLINSFAGLFIIYSSTALPFCIWQMKGYFETLPRDLEEAARMDGLTSWSLFIKVILPLSLPALAITGLFSFMTSWGEYMIAAIVLQDPQLYTLPLGLKSFQASLATDWGLYAAASLIVSAPVVVLFLALSRFLVSGLTVGSVKG